MPHEDRMRVSSVQRMSDRTADRCRFPTEQRMKPTSHASSRRRARIHAGLTGRHRKRPSGASSRIASLLGDEATALIDDDATLPASGVMLMTLEFAKGLEFDHVIIPDAREEVFGDDRVATAIACTPSISRATGPHHLAGAGT